MRSRADSTASGQKERSIGSFLLRGGASVALIQMAALAAGTANQIMLARLLTPEALAAFFLTQSLVEVGAQMGNLGLPRPVTRLVAQALGRGEADRARGVVTWALPAGLLAGIVVAMVYLGGVGRSLAEGVFSSPLMATGTAIAALWIVALSSQAVAVGALRGLRRVGQAALLGGALSRVGMAGVLVLLLALVGSAQFPTALAIATGAAVLSALLAALLLGTGLPGRRADPPAVSVLLRSSMPLLITGVAHISFNRADIWVVGGLLSADEVALYGAAKRLIVLVSLPLVILNLVVPPVVAELYARGELPRLQRAVRGAATAAGLPAVGMLALLWVWPGEVLGLAFGEFYRQGAAVLTILSFERLFFVWVGPVGLVLTMTGHERQYMGVTLAAGAFTVGTVYVGGQLGGLTGVATGFLIGSIVHQSVMWLTVRRLTAIRTDIDPLNARAMLDALRQALGR